MMDFQPIIDNELINPDDLLFDPETDLPTPVGYRILIDPARPVERTEGGIMLAEETVTAQKYTRATGRVLRLGPDAYKDAAKFPSGPWCKPGDWVSFSPYTGHTVTLHIELNPEAKARYIEQKQTLREQIAMLEESKRYAARSSWESIAAKIAERTKQMDAMKTPDGSVDWHLLFANDDTVFGLVNQRLIRTFF